MSDADEQVVDAEPRRSIFDRHGKSILLVFVIGCFLLCDFVTGCLYGLDPPPPGIGFAFVLLAWTLNGVLFAQLNLFAVLAALGTQSFILRLPLVFLLVVHAICALFVGILFFEDGVPLSFVIVSALGAIALVTIVASVLSLFRVVLYFRILDWRGELEPSFRPKFKILHLMVLTALIAIPLGVTRSIYPSLTDEFKLPGDEIAVVILYVMIITNVNLLFVVPATWICLRSEVKSHLLIFPIVSLALIVAVLEIVGYLIFNEADIDEGLVLLIAFNLGQATAFFATLRIMRRLGCQLFWGLHSNERQRASAQSLMR